MSYYYVYALLDPRKNNHPFYIGKGSKNRDRQHLTEECRGENPFKDAVIDKIRSVGLEPIIERIQENMEEDAAYEYEEWLITFFGRRRYDKDGILTNLTEGSRPPSRKGMSPSPESIKRQKESYQRNKHNHKTKSGNEHHRSGENSWTQEEIEKRVATRHEKDNWTNMSACWTEEAIQKRVTTRKAKDGYNRDLSHLQDPDIVRRRTKTRLKRLREKKLNNAPM